MSLEIYPLNFLLDGASLGSKYSTRAGNLLACVVEEQPDVAFALHTRLRSLEVQPKEGTTGLSDEQLLEEAEAAGAKLTPELRSCVQDVTFGSFISANYKSASETGIKGLADGALMLSADGATPELADGPQRLVSTPTVIVNGQQWNQARDGDLESYLLKVKGEYEQAQESPTPKNLSRLTHGAGSRYGRPTCRLSSSGRTAPL